MALTGKRIILTGGSGGLGKLVVAELLREDADLTVVSRTWIGRGNDRVRHIAIDLSTANGIAETSTVVAREEPDKRCGFAMVLLPEQNEQHCPLYALPPAETYGAIARFEHADELFSSRSKIKTLDARLETIELQLRTLIASTIGSDPLRLPSEINERAQERLANETKRNAAFDPTRYKFLPAKLEFCDLRELEKVLINKLLWPKFKDRFGSQEALAIRFGQVAALRNALRHSRHVDDIARTDGEAAIMWFERVLGRTLEPT